MKNPKISVLMPVYNGEQYLREAIQSILDQTYTDFEFLIIDDGSTDGSRNIIDSFNDSRIRIETCNKNMGTVHALNHGIMLARGEYIARMDCDDISLPKRFEHQIRFMDTNPDTGVIGTGMRLIKNGKLKNIRFQPDSDNLLKISLLFNTCFFHPTVFMRSSVIKKTLYPDNLVYTQDYNFWTHLAIHTRYSNLVEPLVYFRVHPEQISSKKSDLQKTNSRLIRESYINALFPETSRDDMEIHHDISENRRDIDLEQAAIWLEHLVDLNVKMRVFPQDVFLWEMSRRWWHCCKKNSNSGNNTFISYKSSYLHSHFKPKTLNYLKFFVRCIVGKLI